MLLNTKNNKLNKENQVYNPELARAMTYEQFQDGDDAVYEVDENGEITENIVENVKFSAFFLRDLNYDGEAEKIKGTCKQIGTSDNMYFDINVLYEGTLKNAQIEIDGKNFYLKTMIPKDLQIKNNTVGNNTKNIYFNDMQGGTQKLISGAARSGDYSRTSTTVSALQDNINNYSRNDNKVVFKGEYIDSNGESHIIRKEIELTVDWYTNVSTSMSNLNNSYGCLDDRVDEENNKIVLEAKFRTYENIGKSLIKNNHVELTLPTLNGYAPIDVKLKHKAAEGIYDSVNRKFKIDNEAIVNENGEITSKVERDNIYEILVEYPLEVYDDKIDKSIELVIPIQSYYECYNNSNTEFSNPYKSNIVSDVCRNVFNKHVNDGNDHLAINIGNYIAMPYYRYVISKDNPIKIYNNQNVNQSDEYKVEWYFHRGTRERNKIILREANLNGDVLYDEILQSNGQYMSTEEFVTYKKVGVDILSDTLANDGRIYIIDEENNEELLTIDKNNYLNYSSSKPFDLGNRKNIRVELENITKDRDINIVFTKEINDNYIINRYSEEEFNDFKEIKSTVVGIIDEENSILKSKNALYSSSVSNAYLTLSKNAISTQETEYNEKIIINTEFDLYRNLRGWGNGIFLVKVPDDIVKLDINSVKINNNNVSIISYEYMSNDMGNFIKIFTSSSTEEAYSITIDCNISTDPSTETKESYFELYAYNEINNIYINKAKDSYDINNNLNIDENVNKDSCLINLLAPNGLITFETISNFNDKNDVVIAPDVANIEDKTGIENTAQVNVVLKNNYSGNITDVQIVGKIPFKGNTSVLGNRELESEFSTTMDGNGIIVPQQIKDKAIIYYSENENVDNNLTNVDNHWKRADEVTDFKKIKTFLIDLGNLVIHSGDELAFNYNVEIPNDVELNKKAYSQHAVYFSLITDEGKYRTSTEPNKVGFRVVRQFELELYKYQKSKDFLVNGATYILSELLDDGKTYQTWSDVTKGDGKITFNNLVANKVYEIKEIKSPENYEINNEGIRFITTVNTEGNLEIEKIEGETKENISIEKKDNKWVAKILVEDEVCPTLKVIKVEKNTNNLINKVTFRLTGEGLPNNSVTYSTNRNGEINLSGLKLGNEYTLTEVSNDEYYSIEPIRFKVISADEEYKVEILSGNVKETEIGYQGNIPNVVLTIENEKIPQFVLEINKIKEIKNISDGQLTNVEPLQDAKFELYKNNLKIADGKTDQNGKILFEKLLLSDSTRNYSANYVLKETIPPNGYQSIKDISFTASWENDKIVLNYTSQDEEKISYTSEENRVYLTIEDTPSFLLTKKDENTGARIKGAKFAIYNVTNGKNYARDVNGKIIGTYSSINREAYYLVTTDDNGEIKLDLPAGAYTAQEIIAADGYQVNGKVEEFSIGEPYTVGSGMRFYNRLDSSSDNEQCKYLVNTRDGGYISIYTRDGKIKKYNAYGNLEWEKRSCGGTITFGIILEHW